MHVGVAQHLAHQDAPQQFVHGRLAQAGQCHQHPGHRQVVPRVLGLGLHAQDLGEVFAVHAPRGRVRVPVVAVDRQEPRVRVGVAEVVVVLGLQPLQRGEFGLHHAHAGGRGQAQ